MGKILAVMVFVSTIPFVAFMVMLLVLAPNRVAMSNTE